MQSKQYLSILFSFMSLLILLAIGYAYYFSKHYPLPITDRISLDAKLQFVRDSIDVESVDTMIVGSSIGLNNIHGEVLENVSSQIHSVVNFSVYQATALQSEQLTHLSDTFPNLKRIIYSAQYSDFPHARKYQNFDTKRWVKYMRGDLNMIDTWLIFFRACRNIMFCIERQREWKSKHLQKNKFEYLGFDSTGSVPLHIYGEDIIGHRWRLPQPGIMHSQSFDAVVRMTDRANRKGIEFYLAHQPYRDGLYKSKKGVKDAMSYFDKRIIEVFSQVKGKLIVLQALNVGDEYFADRSHLNDKGSILVSEAIGKFIDKTENRGKK
ncbi:MAG: hypothetical protein Q9M36_08205 [Sulfurovum sp.]|nr:hypothetical protein [Sulfurovum sp.]